MEFCLKQVPEGGGGGGGGAARVLHISVLILNRLNTTESVIFIYLKYSLLPRGVAVVKPLPVHYHSADYIF